jgi:serine carboxypeptidase-like clade I
MRVFSALTPALFIPPLLFLLLLLLSASAAPDEDEVLSLPGWSGALPSRHYSGYLRIAGGTNLHYYFVASEHAPQTAPTVVWLNGGPGCSSLDGWTCSPFLALPSNVPQTFSADMRWVLLLWS